MSRWSRLELGSATENRDYDPIGDYAVIGDCASIALISRAGSIDWLCWPRFDSPSVLAALLDARRGGRFRVAPTSPAKVTRRYLPGTNVLETTFEVEGGTLRLTDFMSVSDAQDYDHLFWPEHQILRRLECVEGEVEVGVECQPRFDYARKTVDGHRVGDLGWFYRYRGGVVVLRAGFPFDDRGEGARTARIRLRQGQHEWVSLSYDEKEPAIIPVLDDLSDERMRRTLDYWSRWSGVCNYQGKYREPVVRSALALKLLTYAPSGAMVAAATSSLPEYIGGKRNWDYRSCWIRDAAFTLRGLFDLGYEEEGTAFFSWLSYTARRRRTKLSVLYDVSGNEKGNEQELEGLDGYKGSRPVRVGNGASSQFQLDIYGELIGTAFEFVQRGGELDRAEQKLIFNLGESVCKCWEEPDNGIWEVRSGRSRHTYSNAMCWVALDRLVKLAEGSHLDLDRERFEKLRQRIRDEIEQHGYNEQIGSYTSAFDGDTVDASLLLLSLHGYNDPGDERARKTLDVIRERLGRGPLLYRYKPGQDGMDEPEGTFGICPFWEVELLARRGDLDRAYELMDKMVGFANDVGLFSEEIDPDSGELLGNFPQAFTHVGLVNAALTIAEAEGAREESGTHGHGQTRRKDDRVGADRPQRKRRHR